MKLRTVSQLFNTLDPSPFRERDLAKEAEDHIVNYAEDVPKEFQSKLSCTCPPRNVRRPTRRKWHPPLRTISVCEATRPRAR
jgi:hypothetical protein